eukprot:1159046-Pelagomonas_calceolata.AAC.2
MSAHMLDARQQYTGKKNERFQCLNRFGRRPLRGRERQVTDNRALKLASRVLPRPSMQWQDVIFRKTMAPEWRVDVCSESMTAILSAQCTSAHGHEMTGST